MELMKLGIVVHLCNPNTWEAETGEPKTATLFYIASLRPVWVTY
jgi:hypothetical protein